MARIAQELGRRRPDIPLLVVEGRGTADGLTGLPVDLSGLTNLHRMANTPDPRDFYRVSRVVLMPSLWRESLGRVPIEAMANGIPVLASDRGALPETLGDAGFVFTIPDRCTPASNVVPTAHEVAPWVAVIERLWDDAEFEAEHRRRRWLRRCAGLGRHWRSDMKGFSGRYVVGVVGCRSGFRELNDATRAEEFQARVGPRARAPAAHTESILFVNRSDRCNPETFWKSPGRR